MLERLEPRQLLSGVFYDADSHTVQIHGTHGADHIDVSRRGDRILVQFNDHRRWFDRAAVSQVEIDASAGDDLIDTSCVFVPVSAFGRGGRDTIITGAGNDHLEGGDGGDRLAAGDGRDVVLGDGGRDRIYGMAGNDTLRGGANDDTITGGGGNDDLAADEGADLLNGGAGVDWADHTPGRGSVAEVEGEYFVQPNASADPYTRLHAVRGSDGTMSVVVTATHFMGGYAVTFGDLARLTSGFAATVFGTDTAGPGAGRDAALHTEQHTYALGKLADGDYSFTAGPTGRTLAAMTIHVVGAKLVNTPISPGPYHPSGSE